MKKPARYFALFLIILSVKNYSFAQYGRMYGLVSGGSYVGGWADGLGDGCRADSAALSGTGGIVIDKFGNTIFYDAGHGVVRKVSNSTNIITIIAGIIDSNGYGGDGSAAVLARIGSGSGVIADTAGNIYIADGNKRIRKITRSTGHITTVGGGGSSDADTVSATLASISPNDIDIDNAGNLYIACGSRIKKIYASTGIMMTIAGMDLGGYTGDGGPALNARVRASNGLKVDRRGNVYFTDYDDNRIRKIDTAGIISTVAGSGNYPGWVGSGYPSYSGDGGPATLACLADPSGLAIDTSGNLYFSDQNGHVIRKLEVSTGIITTIAGTVLNSGGAGDLWTTGITTDSIHIGPDFMYIDSAGAIVVSGGSAITKIVGASSAIRTLLVTDSTSSTPCALPATVGVGLRGALNGTPLSTDSLTLVVNFGEFCPNPIRTYKVPYWYSSAVYGFGDSLSDLFSYTYKRPGTYTPVIQMYTIGGFTDVTNAPTKIIGSICDTLISSLYVDSTRDTITTATCDTPGHVCFYIWGRVTGSPTSSDSIYVTYNLVDTEYQTHVVPITMSGGVYYYHDTISRDFSSGGHGNIQAQVATSSGTQSTIVDFPGFTIHDSSNGSISLQLLDTSDIMHSIKCALPFTNRYYAWGHVGGVVTKADSISLKFDFGDGTDTVFKVKIENDAHGNYSFGTPDNSDTTAISAVHTYTAPGKYTAADSAFYKSYNASSMDWTITMAVSCGTLSGVFFIDTNANCSPDPDEVRLSSWPYGIINTTAGDTSYGWADDSGLYSVPVIAGDQYIVVADPSGWFWYGGDSIRISCPASGTDTFTASASTVFLTDFAFSCSPPSEIDMNVGGWGWGFVPGDTGVVGVWSNDLMGYICDSLSSTISLTLDPILTYAGMWDGPTPTTISGSTLTWTFHTANDLFQFYGDVKVVCSTTATIGDTVCNLLHISPTAMTDPDTSNNTYHWCEAVSSSWDPNEKQVSPRGIGSSGLIPNGTPLTYLIHFQNTGTALAKKVVVIDTISKYLKIGTLQLVNSNFPVKVLQTGSNVVQFTFDNINLPDSLDDPMGSIGYVAYNILPDTGLTPGTQIFNTAGIYFDYNAAVYTNTTVNTIDEPKLRLAELNKNNIHILPNPTHSIIYITADIPLGKISISDIVGREVFYKEYKERDTQINVSNLAPGVYLIKVNGQYMQKLVKE